MNNAVISLLCVSVKLRKQAKASDASVYPRVSLRAVGLIGHGT
jgi:hypothetical protein